MKIAFISNIRIPTEKAHGYQVSRVCSELSRLGATVELWVPARINYIKKNVFDYYGLEKNFTIKYIPCYDFFKHERIFGRWTYILQSMSFAFAVWRMQPEKGVIVCTRNAYIARVLGARHRVVYNAHNWPESHSRIFKYFLGTTAGILCNSKGTQGAFIERGFTRTTSVPNGVDIGSFKIGESKQQLRTKLDLPQESVLVMYVGHLYTWKGVDVVVDTAEALINNRDCTFVIVGGTEKDVKKYEHEVTSRKLTNVMLLGHQEKSKIPEYIMSADLLLLPNIPHTIESEKYTSPIKMFEYMASSVPIIASDLPSLREVLNEHNSFLVPPQDAHAISTLIERYIKDDAEFTVKAQCARRDVVSYTWEMHAKKVLEFFKTICAE